LLALLCFLAILVDLARAKILDLDLRVIGLQLRLVIVIDKLSSLGFHLLRFCQLLSRQLLQLHLRILLKHEGVYRLMRIEEVDFDTIF
jgi:hypothetical protein